MHATGYLVLEYMSRGNSSAIDYRHVASIHISRCCYIDKNLQAYPGNLDFFCHSKYYVFIPILCHCPVCLNRFRTRVWFVYVGVYVYKDLQTRASSSSSNQLSPNYPKRQFASEKTRRYDVVCYRCNIVVLFALWYCFSNSLGTREIHQRVISVFSSQ